ncbi:MAG: TetR/AcrR family transcriptional regulator [Chloroflexi bacterium]|nr:TetR/AcrR family transcriptional regulator [Chloroflexota bacterium]
MVRPIKKKQIPNLQEAIKETAWKQIAETGAATLSLRAIARELKITAPAIYNYFPSRDDLVTALIVDAFNSLGEAQVNSVAKIAPTKHAERIAALGFAYREWAVTYPQRYHLIFGTPIPNYHAPDDVTLPAAAWALSTLINAIQAAYSAGNVRVENLAKMTPKVKSMLTAWQKFEGGSDLEVLYLALIFWSRVHGLVMLEVTSQIPSFIDDPAELFKREMNNILIQYL